MSGMIEVIYAEIKEQGYTGGATILRDYIQPRRTLRESKATTRYETTPGNQLQHDWGELFVEVAGELRKVYVSVNVLGILPSLCMPGRPSVMTLSILTKVLIPRLRMVCVGNQRTVYWLITRIFVPCCFRVSKHRLVRSVIRQEVISLFNGSSAMFRSCAIWFRE